MATADSTTRKPDLAELLAAVLSHPDIPERLEGAITDELAEMCNALEIFYVPALIRVVLAEHAGRRARRRGGAR